MILPDCMLLQVEKPARYIGNELNMVEKDPAQTDIRFALCFPDVYEVGMSHLGLSILYFFLNRRDDTYCERAFAPWLDMEKLLRENDYELFTLETGDALNQFDFLGFTLQYEMSYTNLVNMLDLSGIPLLSKDRDDHAPIICAGGPCAYNPEPLADIIDFFYIGEGEVALDDILDKYKAHKQNGGTKADFLASLLTLDGVYVPKFYDVTYKANGEIESFTPNHPLAKPVVKKVMTPDFNAVFCPDKQLVPLIETVHDRVALELFRGCMRGCRFCQAGYVYRPLRERKAETLLSQAEALVKSSGHDEISLVSLSTSDFSQFEPLAQGLIDRFQSRQINLSLPSLRIDAFSLALMEKVQGVRKSSLTFAPEAGSQRLRDVVNKGLTESDILDGATLAFQGGWERIKLYFMIGLPTETQEDLLGIVRLSEKIVGAYAGNGTKGRSVSINVSASCFVPKPFTPFQWEAQDDATVLQEKQSFIKKSFRKKQVKFTYHDSFVSVMEGVVSRGDRRVGRAIIRAWALGARFDGWSEHFKPDIWAQAFETEGLDTAFYTSRQRSVDEHLPWDHIDIGVEKDFFIRERAQAYEECVTPNCRVQCALCGVQHLTGGACVGR